MPDMLIKDFIKFVCASFCCYPVFNNTEVRLIYRKQDFKEKNVFSLNGIVADEFQSTLPAVTQSNSGNGYMLNYSWDAADSFYSDRVKDLSDKTLVATVPTTDYLANLNIGRQLTTNDIAYVEADNLYYVIADGTSSPLKWDVYAERLNEYKAGDGETTVDVGFSPLCTYVEFNNVKGLYEKRPYVSTRQKGSYINSKGVAINNPFGLRLFFIQKQQVSGVQVPVSFNHNRNTSNDKILPYSLRLAG